MQAEDDPVFGLVIVDPALHPLYYSSAARPDHIAPCEPDCLNRWRPVLVDAGVPLNSGGAVSALATFRRPDGRLQLAVRRHALYRYVADPPGGAATGNGQPGGWLVARNR